MSAPVIRGRRVMLRPLDSRDISEVVSWEDDEEVIQWIGKGALYALGEGRLGFKNNRCWIYGIENEKGLLIGYIALTDIIWCKGSAELRVCIGQASFRDKGYGTEAIRTFVNFVLAKTHISMVYLRVYRENLRAIRCYEKCGFRKRAILKGSRKESDELRDLVLMEFCPYVV
jgi:ribosomal-protein-alanine N-acetyltransferase